MSSPSEIQQACAERAAHRARLKEVYQRLYNNPFRTKHSLLDPQLFRLEAARAYAKDYYKFTPRSIALPIGLIAFTVWFQTHINKVNAEKERQIRDGEKTYYERALFKSKWAY